MNDYERTDDVATLREIVSVLRTAVAANDEAGARSSQLCGALQTLFARTGDVSLLIEATEVGRAARDNDAAAGLPPQAALLSNLGSALEELHQRQGSRGLLTEAVEVNRQAVQHSRPGDRNLPGRMANLCNSLHSLYRVTSNDTTLLDEAVEVGRDAERRTREQRSPLRAIVTGNLQIALVSLFQRTDDDSLAEEATVMGLAAIEAFGANDPRRAVALANHANGLRALAARAGNREQMEAAVASARASVAAVGDARLDRALCFAGLSASLRLLYSDTGNAVYLDECVRHAMTAVAESTGSAAAATDLADLCLALRLRHDRDGDLASLLWSVEAGRRAFEATGDGQSDRAVVINRLVNSLFLLSEHERNPEVLAEAVTLARLAVACHPPDHPHHAGNLSGLAQLLVATARVTRDPAPVEEAISICRLAASALDDENPEKAGALLNLSKALRASRPRDDPDNTADAIEAVALARTAVSMLPSDSTLTPAAVRTLGEALVNQGTHTCPAEYTALREAHSLLMEFVLAGRGAGARDLIAAARLAGQAAVLAGSHDDAVLAFELAIDLLPRIAPRRLLREDREAAATAAGDPGRALELLEQSRALLQSESMSMRSALDLLADREPELAEEFVRLRSRTDAEEYIRFEATGQGFEPTISDRAATRRRQELMDDWAALLTRIRSSHDDLSRFLLPLTLDELREQAVEGPIVTVYAGAQRSEALILWPERNRSVEVVELTELPSERAVDMAVRLRSACGRIYSEPSYGGRRDAQRDLGDLLGELWDAVAVPVLRACGLTDPPTDGSAPPRLWWCPVGVMAFLPLHAAGRRSDSNQSSSVLDRTVSSYTSTIRALAHSRRAPETGQDPRSGALIISMPQTPDASLLQSADEECDALERLLPDAVTLTGPAATYETVTKALLRSAVVHFICHGVSDLRGRAYGRLLLHDHQNHTFTVADVSRLDIPQADLAYLSACETTDTAPRFADEALHITAAFQTAGYRSVIGSLWKIQGTTGAKIARTVYEELTACGTREPATSESAYALHTAVVAMRAQYPQAPGVWAAHVHFGR
jgi:tetratricopeptide (TPR) repeat protein